MARFSDFSVLSFDCYGTLIDWERGILDALAPWCERVGVDRPPHDLLEAFARHESSQEAETPGMLYPEVLAAVHRRLAAELNADVTDGEITAFGRSVRRWPAFPDSSEALAYLKGHYRLVVLSNVDHESFRFSNAALAVEFDWIFTAEDIGSYKPDPNNFEYMLRELAAAGIDRCDILHTAQSIFHDHVPAATAGLATNWIDRCHDRPGWGATMPPGAMPQVDFRHLSMAEFAAAHRAEMERG